MKTNSVLLLVAVLLMVLAHTASAASVTFTGNVDVDFDGVPGVISRPDNVGDSKGPAGGCLDAPLDSNSFDGQLPVSIPASGFNLERVVTVYDCATDTLYIGLDICDGKIAWDADGDGDILTKKPDILGPGQPLLNGLFTDAGYELYRVVLDVDPIVPGSADLDIMVSSQNGGATITTVADILPAGVTVDSAVTGADVELCIHGLRAAFPSPMRPSLPVRITTLSGAFMDMANEDYTDAQFELQCDPCIQITNGVSCSPDGPFVPSATALRGSDVYFQIAVTNCGTGPTADALKDVVITDMLTEQPGNPLLDCAGCTLDGQPIAQCIPGAIPIGDLAIGQTKTIVCRFPTNAAFDVISTDPDADNTASVSGVGVLSGVVVDSGPVQATVDVLVPEINCTKLIDDDDNFGLDTGDPTPPSYDFRIPSGELNTKQIFYQFCVTNDGEVPVDFAEGQDPNCPSFNDDFIKPGGTEIDDPDNPGQKYVIPGTDQDLNVLFRTRLLAQYGRFFLLPGESVCIVPEPVALDELRLCPRYRLLTDRFQACGFATCYDDQDNPDPKTRCGALCLPPGGGENVSTDVCECTVTICPTNLCVEKFVSCLSDELEPSGKSVQAVRGADIYFYIRVHNCGGEDLKDVVITDTLNEGAGNPLLDCAGCTINGAPIGQCIPGVIDIGNLAVDEVKWIVCRFPTNPAFSILGISPDATNCAFGTGVGVSSGTQVRSPLVGENCVTVDVLVPGIECTKLIDDDSNPVPGDGGDPTPPTQHLNLVDALVDTEQAWYYYEVRNTGEVAVDFTPIPGAGCPTFADDFIKPGGTTVIVPPGAENYLIPGTDQDLYADFLAALQLKYGSYQMPAGGSVEITTDPVTFDEERLCRVKAVWPDTLSVCGIAQEIDVCGSEQVRTICSADVTVCPGCNIEITKEVSCAPDGDFGPSVDALRGSDVYFKITVTNTGGENIEDVELTDVLAEEPGNPLLDCAGCTVDGVDVPNCIPGVWQLGTLCVGESRAIICKFPGNPSFVAIGNSPDVTNCVILTATSAVRQTPIAVGPICATVDVLVPSPGIGALKLFGDEETVALEGTVVTAGTDLFPGFFYVEDENRSSGIRVVSGASIRANDVACVIGTLHTNDDGERYIEASSVGKTGTGSIAPVHINSRALGGGNWFFNPATGAGQCGVVGGLGLNNIGLLVTTWGKVTYLNGAYALDLDTDKSAKVLFEGLSLVGKDTYVRVTGISSCYREADGLHSVIRATEVVPLQ